MGAATYRLADGGVVRRSLLAVRSGQRPVRHPRPPALRRGAPGRSPIGERASPGNPNVPVGQGQVIKVRPAVGCPPIAHEHFGCAGYLGLVYPVTAWTAWRARGGLTSTLAGGCESSLSSGTLCRGMPSTGARRAVVAPADLGSRPAC